MKLAIRIQWWLRLQQKKEGPGNVRYLKIPAGYFSFTAPFPTVNLVDLVSVIAACPYVSNSFFHIRVRDETLESVAKERV